MSLIPTVLLPLARQEDGADVVSAGADFGVDDVQPDRISEFDLSDVVATAYGPRRLVDGANLDPLELDHAAGVPGVRVLVRECARLIATGAHVDRPRPDRVFVSQRG